MIGYIAGFFVVGTWPQLFGQIFTSAWGITALVVAIPCIFLLSFRLKITGCFYLKQSLGLVLSSAIAISFAHYQLNSRLPEALSGSEFYIQGVVSGSPKSSQRSVRFDLEVTGIKPKKSASTISADSALNLRKVRLSWYKKDADFHPGDYFSALVKLKRPHSLWNPYGADYERWALSQGIDAFGYIKDVAEYSPLHLSELSLRERSIAWVKQRFSPAISGSVLALWLGDKSQLTEQQWQVLRDTGTTHLMVVSGLHIGVLLVIGWWLGRVVNALEYLTFAVMPNPLIWPVVISLVISGLYVYLAGFSIPTQRAWLMALVILGGKLWRRPVSVWQRWWVAMALVLTLQPLAFYEVGFWLSFLAVAVLLSVVSIRGRSGYFLSMLRMQWWIFCLLGPVLIFLFGELKLISPLSNLIAIPFISLWVAMSVPALLIELVGGAWALDGLSICLKYFWLYLTELRLVLPWSIEGIASNVAALILALSGSLLVLQPWSRTLKCLGIFGWLPLLFPNLNSIAENTFEARVFDVGQGTAVLIRTASGAVLYDTGMQYSSGATAFETAVLPFLQAQGIRSLERMIISHNDADHAGGAKIAVAHLDVAKVDSGMPAAVARRISSPVNACKAGQSWTLSGVQFRYLHPEQNVAAAKNNRSCVLEVSMPSCRLILMGDVSKKVEQGLIGTLRSAHWLLVGHHGSNTSTSQELIDAVSPQVALVSAGYLNRYRHPHFRVLDRLQKKGVKVFRTDQSGALHLFKDKTGQCQTRAWREVKKPYWSSF